LLEERELIGPVFIGTALNSLILKGFAVKGAVVLEVKDL